MRFLVDNALSPALATSLRAAGHDAVHIRGYGMQRASDADVLHRAAIEDRIVVSADTDFAAILALGDASRPSLNLFRSNAERRPSLQAFTILRNLPRIEGQLEGGAVVTIEAARIRERSLPIGAPWPEEHGESGSSV